MLIKENNENDVFCFVLQFIHSLQGQGMFFLSAKLIRRLRSNTTSVRQSEILYDTFMFEEHVS